MFPIESEIVIKLIISILLGGAIGLEREMSSKPAGFRTNVLICFGSALFTIISIKMCQNLQVLDLGASTRIVAQIVTGIGFIGAGTVLRGQGSIQGLTSAATIWAVAAIGMAIGVGEVYLAIISTVLIGIVLTIFGRLENYFNARRRTNK